MTNVFDAATPGSSPNRTLNEEQYQAATAPIGPVIVAAGPGSGKTRVINSRITWMIHELAIAPDHIAAFTFTNKAANEMIRRLQRTLGEETSRKITAGTFHSWGARFLRYNGHVIDVPTNYSIYDRGASRDTVASIIQDNADFKHPDINTAAGLKYITDNKAKGITADQAAAPYAQLADRSPQTILAKIWLEYEARLKRDDSLDFDDLLIKSLEILRTQPEILASVTERHPHLLIDEYQDTSQVQQRMTALIAMAGAEQSLFVVGDPDQSIYAFRSARINGILEFSATYPECRIYHLTHNYRSTPEIIDAAQNLIDFNTARIEREANPIRAAGSPLNWIRGYNADEEARLISRYIWRLKMENDAPWNDFCVAYRTHQQSRVLSAVLREDDIPFTITGDYDFFNRQEIKLFLNWLRLVQNPKDETALLNVVKTPPRGIGQVTLRALRNAAHTNNISMNTMLAEIHAEKHSAETLARFGISEKIVAKFNRLQQELTTLQDLGLSGSPLEVIVQLSDLVGLRAYIEDQPDAESRITHIQDLRNMADGYPAGSLTEFLEHVAVSSERKQQEEQSINAVTLTTLHQAKGLEFPHCVISGVETGLLPHSLCRTAAEIEEERRLFYVGVTRAKDTLAISWSQRRNGRETGPSKFIAEIPEESWCAPPPIER